MTPRLQELELFKAQQESKSGSTFSANENNSVTTSVPRKRKITKVTSDKEPPSKRQKDTTSKVVDASHADSIKDTQSMHNAVDKAEQSALPMAVETKASSTHLIGDSKSKSKPILYNDQCTAYISNISLGVSWLSFTLTVLWSQFNPKRLSYAGKRGTPS